MKCRPAVRGDLPTIVWLIAEDNISQTREALRDPLPDAYYRAFDIIESRIDQEVIVIENDEGEVVGTFHLSFLQFLTFQGGLRAQIEAVHVRSDQRNKGIGRAAMQWAIDRARQRGCHLVQLTTDKRRTDARRFYEHLGFKATHEGMKLHF